MAITKLMNMKESKSGEKSKHLAASIRYILNPQKTENGMWTWSNAGAEWKQIFDTFMETKKEFQKLDGRQGYHFVISFAPGEVDEQTAFSFGKDFCQEYLKDYDYVFAVHNDQPHMHIHIVFNSIDFIEGYKYRYVKGDWEKNIQPITDRLCQKYGLSQLQYEPENKVGVSYGERFAQKNDNMTKSEIICMDIDYAITRANTMDEFYELLQQQGYQIKKGFSKKLNKEYVSYQPPQWSRAKRDYRLGPGYSLEDISSRLREKNKEAAIQKWVNRMAKIPDKIHVMNMVPESKLQVCMVRRIRNACRYQYFDLILIDQIKMRNDLQKVHTLCEDINYILDTGITTTKEVEAKLKEVSDSYSYLKKQSSKGNYISEIYTDEEVAIRNEYFKLLGILLSDEELSDEEFEKTADRLEYIENNYDPQLLEEQSNKVDDAVINELYQERRILKRILRNQDEILSTPEYALQYELDHPQIKATINL